MEHERELEESKQSPSPGESESSLSALAVEAFHQALVRGLLVVPSWQPLRATIVNFSLLPVPMPRAWMERAQRVSQQLFAVLRRCQANRELVASTMQSMGQDPFMAKLEQLRSAPAAAAARGEQRIRLDFVRNDFMLDRGREGAAPPPGGNLALVEMNTMSAALASHVAAVSQIQRALFGRFPGSFPSRLREEEGQGDWLLQPGIAERQVKCFAVAVEEYCRLYGRTKQQAGVLIVANPLERNSLDIYRLEELL